MYPPDVIIEQGRIKITLNDSPEIESPIESIYKATFLIYFNGKKGYRTLTIHSDETFTKVLGVLIDNSPMHIKRPVWLDVVLSTFSLDGPYDETRERALRLRRLQKIGIAQEYCYELVNRSLICRYRFMTNHLIKGDSFCMGITEGFIKDVPDASCHAMRSSLPSLK